MLLEFWVQQQINNKIMSLFPFHLSKSKINEIFWNVIFLVGKWKFFMGLVSVMAPEGIPLPAGLPIWAQGQLWDGAVDGWLAQPCLLHLALSPSPWTCLVIWTLSWTWSLSPKCLCLPCPGTIGLCLWQRGHPAVLTFSSQPTLLSRSVSSSPSLLDQHPTLLFLGSHM